MRYFEQTKPLVSILINNYNYGHFIAEAINSSLEQTFSSVEVIVVDDGSTDNSREIISSYGNKIIPIFQENGGQASAFNSGVAASRGDLICILDSDDIFALNKIQKIINFLKIKSVNDPKIFLYHPLEAVTQHCSPLGFQKPRTFHNYQGVNFYQFACQYGFVPHHASPTSGISFSRELAELIFPLPETINISADSLIVRAGFLLGKVYEMQEVLGQYRIHGNNNWFHANNVQKIIKPKLFLETQDKYLNQKLEENQKESVISFFESMDARSYFWKHGSSTELLKLGLKVLRRHINKVTIYFFISTMPSTVKRFIKELCLKVKNLFRTIAGIKLN